MEAGKKRLAGDAERQASSAEVKDLRSVAMRFDKLARNSRAALYLFAVRLWLSY